MDHFVPNHRIPFINIKNIDFIFNLGNGGGGAPRLDWTSIIKGI